MVAKIRPIMSSTYITLGSRTASPTSFLFTIEENDTFCSGLMPLKGGLTLRLLMIFPSVFSIPNILKR